MLQLVVGRVMATLAMLQERYWGLAQTGGLRWLSLTHLLGLPQTAQHQPQHQQRLPVGCLRSMLHTQLRPLVL
jgi:hypothetical protein